MVACSRGQVGGLGVDGIVDRGWVVGWGWGCAPSKAPNHPLTASKPPGQSSCNFQHTTSPERKSAEKKILNYDKVAYQQGTYGFPIVTRWQGRALRILIESSTAAESARWSSVWSRVNWCQEDFLGTLKSPTKRAAISLL